MMAEESLKILAQATAPAVFEPQHQQRLANAGCHNAIIATGSINPPEGKTPQERQEMAQSVGQAVVAVISHAYEETGGDSAKFVPMTWEHNGTMQIGIVAGVKAPSRTIPAIPLQAMLQEIEQLKEDLLGTAGKPLDNWHKVPYLKAAAAIRLPPTSGISAVRKVRRPM